MTRKTPVAYPIATLFRKIREAIRPYAPAALFELADEDFRSPYHQVVACILSIRTRDETSIEAAQLRKIASRVESEFGGELPCDPDVIASLPGVGPKYER